MSNEKKYSIIKMNFIALKYVLKFCPVLAIFALLRICAAIVISIFEVEIISEAISIIINNESLNHLYIYLIEHTSVIIFCSIIEVIYNRYISQKYRVIYDQKMQTFLYFKVKHIDMESYDNPEFYDRFSRAINDSTWRGIAVFNTFVNFIQSLGIAIALGTYVILTDIWLIFIIIVNAIIYLFVTNIINKIWFKIYKDTSKHRRFNFYIKRTFYQQKYAAEMKTTNVDELLLEKYEKNIEEYENIYRKGEKKIIIFRSIERFGHNLIEQAGSYIYLIYRLFNGMGVDVFTATVNATFRFFTNFISAVNVFSDLRNHSLYISDFIWITSYQPKIERNDGLEEIEDFNELSIKNIKFKYPGNDNYSIDGLSLKVKRGEKIAIVGDNGGGKTTLMKLLLRFYNPNEGIITFNGININEFNEKRLREEFSIVFQDFQIYAVSIAENVLMRRIKGESDIEKVHKALEKVGLLEKVLSFKDGIYTQVTREFDQDGATFSGGERQRLAIARVFASNAHIYILDEPTSALDPLAEERINKLIIKNTDKTMLIIAHRLSTVVDADKIYLIRKGQIMEEGTHDELMALDGDYCKMFNTQKSLYEKQNQ